MALDPRERRLCVVHAHPDDESITTGGLLARYASEGARVCLVTCTDGQLGEIAELPGPQVDDLATTRRAELADACRALGFTDVRLLGYHDSGMAGTPDNEREEAFVNQPVDEVADRIAQVLRELRPQVVVTYDDTGLYGHPDHIQTHLATRMAAEVSGVDRLFYAVISRARIREVRRTLAGEGASAADHAVVSDENIELVGTDDALIDVRLDVSRFVDRKIDALRAHRTQWGTTRMFLELPDAARTILLATEDFALAHPGGARPRDDLFDGL